MKKIYLLLILTAILSLSLINAIEYTLNNNTKNVNAALEDPSGGIEFGVQVTLKITNMSLFVIEKGQSTTATKCFIRNSTMNLISNGSFVGNNCSIYTNYNLPAGVYYFTVNNSGSAYNSYRTSVINPFPIDNATLFWNASNSGAGFPNLRTDVINDIQAIWTSTNLTFAPVLNSPLNNTQILSTTTQQFNATVTTTTYALNNTRLYLWFTNGTLWQTQLNTTNNGNIALFNISSWVSADFFWNVLGVMGNGVGGNSAFAVDNYTISIRPFQIMRQTYNNPVMEKSDQLFNLILSLGTSYSLSTINLNYNNTNYSGTFTQINSTTYNITASITTPYVSSNINKTFYWGITLTEGTYFNSTFSNQTVLNFDIDNCGSYTIRVLNLTLVNEALQNQLNGSLDNTSVYITINIYPNATTSVPVYQFSNFYNKTNPIGVCFNNNTINSTFYMDATISYDADGYTQEFYNIQGYSLNSSSGLQQNITLYDLLDTSTQAFKISYKDSSFLGVQNALILIQRKYINEGIFKTIEIPKTDINGYSVGHLVTNDVIYSFTIVKNGQILATFPNVYAICQNPLIETCTIELNAFSGGISVTNFSELNNFLFNLVYNNNTRTVSSTFTILPIGTVATIFLNVSTEDALGTSVCSSQVTTSAGTVSCVVPNTFGNSTVRASLYKDGVKVGWGNVNLNLYPSQIYSGSLIFILLLTILTLIGVSVSDNPIITVLSFMIGIILLISLNLIYSHSFVGSSATVLYLIIGIVLLLIKSGRRN